jgi:lipopolysaccharide transport system permease protein
VTAHSAIRLSRVAQHLLEDLRRALRFVHSERGIRAGQRARHPMKPAALDNDMPSSRTLVLEAGRADRHYWADIWLYRELLAILAYRDISVRYKQTLIGVAWAVVRPLATIAVFTVIFGKLAKLPSDGETPYALLVFAGMLPWFLFSTVLNEASLSLVTNGSLISKVYFPRIIIPLATSAVALLDFFVNLALFLLVMAAFGEVPSWRILVLPALIALTILVSIGPSLLIAALNVKYRDFRYIVPFIVQFGLYVSPVGFSSNVVPDQWRILYSLNPMVGIIDGFRWCLTGGHVDLYIPGFLISIAVSVGLLVLGVGYFRRTEKTFADHI